MKETFRVIKDKNNDQLTLIMYIDRERVGDFIIKEHFKYESFFDPFVTESTYNELIPDDMHLELISLFVSRDMRGQGISNKLLAKLNPILKSYFSDFKIITLWASPFSTYAGNHLELDILKELYRKFGFEDLKLNLISDEQKFEYEGNIMIMKINQK